MENEIIESNFDTAVSQYRLKQKDVLKNFIYGCIELGAILAEYHDEFTKSRNWLKFLEEIDIHPATANQQIRLYEISKEKIEKDVLAEVITNREKLNLFLALNDEEKEKVLQKGLDSHTSNADFKNVITEVKDEGFEDVSWKKMVEETSGENPLLVDTKR